MSSDVVLTSALRSNLLSLQNTQRLIDDTQLKLATGLRVNSALDNPQNFFAAQSLNNRASDLGRLLDGISQSIRTIETADNGIKGLTDLVEQAESVALEAQSEIRSAEGFAQIRGTEDLSEIGDLTTLGGGGVIAAGDDFVITVREAGDTDATSTVSTSADINIAAGETIYDVVAAINSDANVGTARADGPLVRASVTSEGQLLIESLSEGASIRVADGTTSPGADGFAALGLGLVATEETLAATRQGGTAVAGTTIASDVTNVAANPDGSFNASDTLAAAGYLTGFASDADDVTLSITVDGQQTDVGEFDDTETIQDFVDDINAADIDGVTEARFNTTTGRIEIEFEDTVGTAELQFTAVGAGDVEFGFGTGAAGFEGNEVALAAGQAVSEQFTFVGTSTNLEQFEDDFNNVLTQIDTLVEDAGYRGINLLNGDNLITDFNEDRTSTLTTEGVTFDSTGLGIAEGDFTNAAGVTESIQSVRNALASVRNFGQSIANDLAVIQTRRDFTESTINTLEAGADDLTVADQNEEGANLLALQTRQTLAVTSLSLASQSQQAVLRLF